MNILLQLSFTVIALIVFGLIIWLCNYLVYRMLGRGSRTLVIATGIIGTPMHELSHALMCVLFGHKITGIKLFDANAENGALGYVKHAYNKRNVYHVIGNFFIGIAPVLIGSLIIFFLEWLLVRHSFDATVSALGAIDQEQFFESTFNALGVLLRSFFSVKSFASITWWLFLLLSLPLSLHMDLSSADVKGAVPGFLAVIGLSIAINAVIALISIPASDAFTSAIATFGVYLVGTLLITLVMALILVFIAFTVYVARLLLRKV